MTGPPLSRAYLKLQNTRSRAEQVKAENEEARQRELDQTATLRAQRLAKEEAEKNNTDAKTADGEKPAKIQDNEWPWRLPQPHRH